MSTAYHAQYWAYALTVRGATDTVDNLTRALSNARVDLNPHQVDAALFAVRSPLSRGVILADEGSLCLEHSARDELPEPPAALVCEGTRSYGESCLTFYRPRAEILSGRWSFPEARPLR